MVKNGQTNGDNTLSRVPAGLGANTGLSGSIPAVRVWGIVRFERAYSGNESSGINEAFTDIEPFVTPDGQLDARARIRATKFNYIRESKFRELIRRAAEPYLIEVAGQQNPPVEPPPNLATTADPAQTQGRSCYEAIATQVFEEVLKPVVPTAKASNYLTFFKALLVKMAACSPATPCGACPACIGEGSAATTQSVGVSLPHNWEKKFKETDFRTFRTVKSAAKDLMLNVDGQTVEPSLTESLTRNRTPRTGDPNTANTVENTAQSGNVALEGMMILREHMFKGLGYVKTTLFNPTRLELGLLGYEHLVEDVRRGAKTSSGAGAWGVARRQKSKNTGEAGAGDLASVQAGVGTEESQNNNNDEPMLVVDEILGLEGFTIKAPPAGTPLDVTEDSAGIAECFDRPLEGSKPNSIEKFLADGNLVEDGASAKEGAPVLVRYRGSKARERLQKYLAELNHLSPSTDPDRQTAFTDLAQFAANVIAYLIRPKKAIQNIMAQFEATQAATASPTQGAATSGSVPESGGRRARSRSSRGETNR